MSKKSNKSKLNIFLIKEGLKPDTVLSSSSFPVQNILDSAGKSIGKLYLKLSHAKRPSWLAFYETHNANLRDLVHHIMKLGNSLSGVFILEASNRTFAVVYGHSGRFMVSQDAIEEKFGLKTTLNRIHKDKMKAVEQKRL